MAKSYIVILALQHLNPTEAVDFLKDSQLLTAERQRGRIHEWMKSTGVLLDNNGKAKKNTYGFFITENLSNIKNLPTDQTGVPARYDHGVDFTTLVLEFDKPQKELENMLNPREDQLLQNPLHAIKYVHLLPNFIPYNLTNDLVSSGKFEKIAFSNKQPFPVQQPQIKQENLPQQQLSVTEQQKIQREREEGERMLREQAERLQQQEQQPKQQPKPQQPPKSQEQPAQENLYQQQLRPQVEQQRMQQEKTERERMTEQQRIIQQEREAGERMLREQAERLKQQPKQQPPAPKQNDTLLNHPAPKNELDQKKVEFKAAKNNLLIAIQAMDQYANDHLQNSSKKQVVVDLSANLKRMVEEYLPTMHWDTFETNFKNAIQMQEPELSKYRARWQPIVGNILIALTGLGAIALAIYAGVTAYQDKTKHRPLAFFQKDRTTSEKNLEEIANRFTDLKNKKPK